MPSTIAPIDKTRSYAVQPAQGLRFGNFERVVHLPPVKQPSTLGLHSYSTLNNQQIYRTVGDWVQSWQPWQQKVLLYSIVNRCTLPQLEILATTLEPLRHRDPLNASRRKPAILSLTPSMKSSISLKSTPPKLSIVNTPQHSPQKTSRESKKSLLRTLGSKDGPRQKPEKMTRTLNLDQYASMVSSAVVAAALGEISFVDNMDNIRKGELDSSKPGSKERDMSNHIIAKVGDVATASATRETSKLSSAVEKDKDKTQQPPPSSANARPGILRTSSGKRADRSRNASAQFLGGRIVFTPQSRQSHRSQRSGSSRYRHSVFASSAASTPDFFFREKIPVLGPMHRTIRSGQVQRPVGLGNIPVSMQQFYKNRSWWPNDLPDNMHLFSAQKRELSSSFRDQLAIITEWLNQWEYHERLSLLKEVVKLCNADVLEDLVIYIHQKLRDACDINRLPDKLLLYVLSHLAPKDILNSGQVCRRWRYLCAMDDLWIVKCLELGEEEGIENVPHLIESANRDKMGVDWMLAYMELHSLVTTMKEADARSITSQTDRPTQRGETSERDRLTQRGEASERDTGREFRLSKRFRIRRHKDGKGEVTDTDSETAAETVGKGKRIQLKEEGKDVTGDKGSEAGSGMSEEDLSALVGDEDGDLLFPEMSRKQPGRSKSNRKSLRSKVQHRIQETVSEKSSTDDKAEGRSSKASGGRRTAVKEEEEEETALDIHTDLSQSQDLLGKVVPAMSLEWQTPAHEDDFIRYPVYAGKVVTVQKVRKVQGHIGGIQCLQFDKRRLFTGGVDRVVRLWDVRSSRSVHKFYGHMGGVRCVKFDDDILVTGSWDSVIFVWNIRRFTRAAILHGHENSISCLQLVKHYVISGSHDHTVRVWSRPTYMCTLVLRGHSGPVLSLAADNEHVYSAATDLTIRMTDLLTGMCERVFERANVSPIHCLSMHGALLLGGDSEGRVYFWNTTSGEAEAAVKVHEQAINTIQYHNGRFYTGSSDGTMTEYDLMTMTCLRVLRGHKGPIRALQVSDRRFVSCSDDGTVRIWDLHTDKTTSLSSVF